MDSFFGIGITELFFIAIIALIVLGPERLPGAIREFSKFMRTIRNLSSELTSQFSEEMKALDEINPTKILRELTEDPAEANKDQAKSSAQAAKPAATKTAAKPAAKPATGSATAAKPAGTSSTTRSTTSTSTVKKTTGSASGPTTSGSTAAKPATVKKDSESEQAAKPVEQLAGEDQENTILPPQGDAQPAAPTALVDGSATPPAEQPVSATLPPPAVEPPQAPASEADAVQADEPIHTNSNPNKEDKLVDAATAKHAVSVNGTSKTEGEA
jgi:sec-independent protein translocase protein TatB